VILGSGTAVANTLTLSNAELGRISAGVLGIDGGAISNDAAVAISGIASVSLIGASAQFSDNFTVSGNLLAQLGGGFTLIAGSAPVLMQAGSIALTAGSVTIQGGTASGAYAAIQTTAGDVNINAGGAIDLASGTVSNSDAVILSSRNIAIAGFSCSGCTVLPNLTPSVSPLINVVTDTGVAVAPGGNISVTSVTVSNPVLETVKSTTSDAGVATATNTATTIAPPAPLAIQPPTTVATGAQSGGAMLTDPNGTVGGQAGTFGGSASESSGGAPAQGGASGGKDDGKKAPAKKANARC
jgi:hypothetical protein